MRWLIASSAWSWPMTRVPRCSSSVEHGGDLVLQHLADGNAGPAGDHFADDLRVHADAHQRRFALQRVEFGVQLGELGAQLPPDRAAGAARRRLAAAGVGDRAVFQLARGARGSGCTRSRSFSQRAFSACQACFGRGLLLGDCCQPLGCDRRPAAASRSRTRVCTARSSSVPGGVFDGRRSRVLAERQARAGGVEHADRLVGQLAVRRDSDAKAARRPPGLRPECARCDASPAPARRRASSAGIASSVGSSTLTTWKRRARAGSFSKYFLYSDQVVAAMVRSSPRASAGFSRLAASSCPACAAGADHGVRFVDEQDDGRGRGLHLVDQALQPILEFALDAGAGLQQRQVERAHGDVLAAAAARRPARCAARSLPPPRSCRRRLRRPGSDCSGGGASGCRPPGGSRNRGPAPDRSCPCLRVLGQIDGELIEVRSLAAGRGRAAVRRRVGRCGRCAAVALRGLRHDGCEVLAQGVRLDLLQLLADVADDARQLVVADQGEDACSRCEPCRRRNRCEPRVQASVNIFSSDGLSAGVARVAGLQLVEAARQFRGQARLVDAEVLRDRGEVAVRSSRAASSGSARSRRRSGCARGTGPRRLPAHSAMCRSVCRLRHASLSPCLSCLQVKELYRRDPGRTAPAISATCASRGADAFSAGLPSSNAGTSSRRRISCTSNSRSLPQKLRTMARSRPGRAGRQETPDTALARQRSELEPHARLLVPDLVAHHRADAELVDSGTSAPNTH